MATLTAYIFQTKHDIHNQTTALETMGPPYIVSKCHELWSTNSLNWTAVQFKPLIKFNQCLLIKTRHIQLGKGVGKYKGSPTSPQNFMNVGPQTAQNRTQFFTHSQYSAPPSVNYAFFIARLRRWRSANETQRNFAK